MRSFHVATLIAAGIALATPAALALDGKVVLDQLVKKGVLTAEEADAIIKQDNDKKRKTLADPANAHAKLNEVTNLTVYGKLQTQFKAVHSDDRAGNNANVEHDGFEVRRVDIGAAADIGEIAKVDICYRAEITNTAGTSFQLDKGILSFDGEDYGQFTVGLKKAPFGYEEYTSSGSLNTVERGLVNNYISGNGASAFNLGLGERRIGAYWDSVDAKKVEKKGGTKFGLAVTNDIRRAFDQGSNDFTYYANVMHVEKFADESSLEVGLNSVYTDSEANRKTTAGSPTTGMHSYGLEGYAKYHTGAFTFIADVYQTWIENGRGNAAVGYDTAAPVGCVLTAMYRMTESLEPVISFNYLDTDGRGVQSGDVIRNAQTFAATDAAYSLFVGGNWYITPKSLKLSAGVELARFENSTQGSSANVGTDVIGGRMQLQALF